MLNDASWPKTRPILLGQWLHQAIYRKHIEALGGHVELGTKLVGVEQDDLSVRAKLERSSDGQTVEEIASFQYVVGTDGARSQLFLSIEPKGVLTATHRFRSPYDEC